MENNIFAFAIVAHELFGTGLKHILQKGSDQRPAIRMQVVTDLRSALDFSEREQNRTIRLVVVDIDAPMMAGRMSIDALQRRFPSASIIVAIEHQSRAGLLEILAWGSHGVILKTQSADEIRHAMDIVLKGGIFVPQTMTPTVPTPAKADGDLGLAPNIVSRPDLRLSERQTAVLALLTEGLSNKGIARRLDLAEATVKVHVNAVFRALNVHNRASAVAAVLSSPSAAAWHCTPKTPSAHREYPASRSAP